MFQVNDVFEPNCCGTEMNGGGSEGMWSRVIKGLSEYNNEYYMT